MQGYCYFIAIHINKIQIYLRGTGIAFSFAVHTISNQEVFMKKVLVIMTVVACIAFTGTSFAYGPRGGGFGMGVPCLAEGRAMHKDLNLTKEQAERMWQLKDKFYNDTKSLRYNLFRKNFELKGLYDDPNVQDATILSKQKEIHALRAQLQDKRAEYKLAQRKILTPEQIKKLDERRDGRFGHGPRGGFRPAK